MTDAIKALCKAQKEMGSVVKNARNPHLKSKYADLGSVMDACFDALHSNGFAVMQPGGQDEYGPFVSTIFAHESGQQFESKCYLVLGKNDMQGVGSAWTYARRYGLLGMAGLAPEDDDGEATKRPPQQPRQEPKPEPFDAPATRDRIKGAISKAPNMEKLENLMQHAATKDAIAKLPPPMQGELEKAFSDRMGQVFQAPLNEGEAA